ncbi:MAG: SulP family inorganic anion transporter [Alphaproteobacteria bacterium]|nr:SulP family inorganic anion transporter [Alphaproteobacteria bacterium]
MDSDRLESGWLPNLRYDLPAGLVVFLVALPLCLGIALASDAPLISGVLAGIVGGLVVAALSGSALSVSGPAAGLAVIVADGIHTLGTFEAFLAAVVVSGIVQVILGAMRAGIVATLFPLSVIKGMLAAIGIILILKQIPHALGHDVDYEGDLSFQALGHQANTFSEIADAFMSWSPGVALLTLASIAVLIAWERKPIAGSQLARVLPGPLVVVVMGVVVNELYAWFVPSFHITAAAGHLVTLPVFDTLGEARSLLTAPDLTRMLEMDVVIVGVTIAIVGSIETLLSLEAVDKLDPYKRVSPPNRELLAQGVGNVVSGMVGGLPITAVIVRSSANVYAGARTRQSAVIHGLFLLALVVAVPALLNRIPLGCLAAVLLMVGYKLARIKLFQDMWARGIDQFLPFVATIVVTVFSDLLMGVAVGFVLAAIMVVLTNFHTSIVVVQDGDDYLVKFTKDVSFLNKPKLAKVLASIPRGARVVIDGTRASFIDFDILEAVDDFATSAALRGITVERRGVDTRAYPFTLSRR